MRFACVEDLLNNGFPLDPDTVIIRMEGSKETINQIGVEPTDEPVPIMFKNMWIELPWPEELSPLTAELNALSGTQMPEIHICMRVSQVYKAPAFSAYCYWVVICSERPGDTHWIPYTLAGSFFLDGEMVLNTQHVIDQYVSLDEYEAIVGLSSANQEQLWLKAHYQEKPIEEKMFLTYSVFISRLLAYIGAGREVELVEAPRNRRRRFERTHGKAPSPYVLIRVDEPGKPRKVYRPTGRGSGTKKAFHIVRGHFRHYGDHKLPWLANQTFFIEQHTAGGKKDEASGKRPYRVVLK